MLTPVYASPRWLLRNRSNTVSFPVSGGRSLVSPTEGTYSLQNPAGELVYSGAITVVEKVATATVSAELLPATLDLGDGWLESWTLVFDSGTQYWERVAAVVRSALTPTIDDLRLEVAAPWLKRLGANRDFSEQRQLTWELLLAKLSGLERWPWLILSSDALQPVHLYMTLELLCADPSLPAQYAAQAPQYAKNAADALATMPLKYDSDGDGLQDTTGPAPTSRAAAWTADRGWMW